MDSSCMESLSYLCRMMRLHHSIHSAPGGFVQTRTRLEVSLRPVQDEDRAFALSVFASTRARERDAIEWTPGAWTRFIQTQFAAQCNHYTTFFPDSEHMLILDHGKPVGRAWIYRCDQEIRLVDIAILPAHRSRGIGTHVIQSLQRDAADASLPVRHSVELENPRARALYERLGFVATETRGLHTLMEWNA